MEQRTVELLRFIRKGTQMLDALLSEIAQRWQISPSEAHILLFLSANPHLNTAKDAAAYCGMSKASVSGNVLKLTTRGLLTVDVDLADRRFQHLTPTEQARPILDSIREKMDHFSNKLLVCLTGDERAQFFNALLQINHQDLT